MEPSVLYLSRRDVERVGLPMAEIIAAVEAVFREKGSGRRAEAVRFFFTSVRAWYSILAMQPAIRRRALAGLLGLLFTLLGGGLQPPRAAAPAPTGAAPDLRLGQIHMVETRDGATLWELWADRAELREREGSAVLVKEQQPVRIVLHAPQGELTCTTNRVVIDLPTKDVRLEGAVVARTDQGAELRTEALRWIAATRRLTTDESVTVSRGGLVSRGRGMEADTGLERVRLFHNITSQMGGPEVSRALRPAPAGRGRVR